MPIGKKDIGIWVSLSVSESGISLTFFKSCAVYLTECSYVYDLMLEVQDTSGGQTTAETSFNDYEQASKGRNVIDLVFINYGDSVANGLATSAPISNGLMYADMYAGSQFTPLPDRTAGKRLVSILYILSRFLLARSNRIKKSGQVVM